MDKEAHFSRIRGGERNRGEVVVGPKLIEHASTRQIDSTKVKNRSVKCTSRERTRGVNDKEKGTGVRQKLTRRTRANVAVIVQCH